MQEILGEKIQFKLKLQEQTDKLEMLIEENKNLKDKVNELEADNKGLRK